MGTAKQDLLDQVIGVVAERGLTDLSLRELAAAAGTSHRMLNYHFGGRDGLVAAIVEAVEAQQRTALEDLAAQITSPRDLITAQWAQLSDPSLRPFVILFFELLAMSLHQRPGTERFLDQLTDPWLDLGERIAADLGTEADRDQIRLGVAVTRGLLLEATASGGHAAATRSLHRFLELWDTAPT